MHLRKCSQTQALKGFVLSSVLELDGIRVLRLNGLMGEVKDFCILAAEREMCANQLLGGFWEKAPACRWAGFCGVVGSIAWAISGPQAALSACAVVTVKQAALGRCRAASVLSECSQCCGWEGFLPPGVSSGIQYVVSGVKQPVEDPVYHLTRGGEPGL